MTVDILPELLERVKREFELSYGQSAVVARALEDLLGKKATYVTANELAVEVGQILSEALGKAIRGSELPDGKMYYNIAKRLLEETLGRNFAIVSDYAGRVQQILNESAKIGLKVQKSELNQDRIDGLVNRIASEDSFDDVAWLLGEPIVTFSQSIIDDSIRVNADFHAKAGLTPQIVRKEGGKCCDWCRAVVGLYEYPKVPDDVYRRHQRCRCTVEYDPKSGKVRDVWSKTWRNKSQQGGSGARKSLNLVSVDEQERKRYNRLMKSSGAVYGAWNDKNDPYNQERDRHATMYYEAIRNRDKQAEIDRVARNSGFVSSDIEKIYNHIFIQKHELDEGYKRFDPNYDMAESWRRLSENQGKNIQPHDIVMLKHELMELELMGKGLSYDEAHNRTNDTYNYQVAWIKWIQEKGDQ